MGLLGRIKKALSPSVEERIKAEAKEKVNGLRELTQRGASKEQIKAYIDQMMSNTEFNQILGHLNSIAPRAISLSVLKHHTDEKVDANMHKSLWNDYTRAQQDADRFFGNSQMRSWVTARSLKEKYKSLEWNFIDHILSEDDSWGRDFREELWWIVPWSFAIADEVEERHGHGSCNAEKFHSMWKEMTNQETVHAFLKTLSDENIAYYRCTD